MQISLAFSVSRCRDGDREVASRILRGHLDEAVRVGLQRLWRPQAGADALHRALLGQMIGRTLLALGREQEAQEVLQELRRTYDQISRQTVRWGVSLDQGWIFLSLNRPGRAIECFRALIDDTEAPVDIVVEAMNCMADALQALGESQRGLSSVCAALVRCAHAGREDLSILTECHRLELVVMQMARRSDELSDHALSTGYRDRADASTPAASLRRELADLENSLTEQELVAHRLQHLQLMLTSVADGSTSARFVECLGWLKDRRLAGLEPSARIDSAIALLAGGAIHAAGELLSSLAQSDAQARQSRYSMDLQYCRSKVYLMQGQMTDAMRAYKQHVEQAVFVLKRDFAQVAQVRDMQPAADVGDAFRLRLPLKYRGAYQFIIDHLTDSSLSIKDVASHAGVTERSLQLAFRAHLGLTPAEFIRRRRMQGIHHELESIGGIGARVSVLDIAARWGVCNRSTLAQNYRQIYAETPFETLHGKSRAIGDE